MIRRPMMAAMLALTVLLGGCSDSNDPDADPAIGTWVGTYGSGAATGPYDYTFTFLANGTMQAIDGLPPFDAASDAVGTWTRTGSVVTGTYQYPAGDQFSFTGTLSATTGAAGSTLTGTWGSTPSTTDGGGFVVTKQ